MKKKILALVSLLLMGGVSTYFFSSCDKDTTCYVKIIVNDEETKMPVQDVFVKILDIDTSYGNTEGTTDAAGMFETEFRAPAILNVNATLETGYDDTMYTREKFYCYRTGKNTIRLKEGETVESTIILESHIYRELR